MAVENEWIPRVTDAADPTRVRRFCDRVREVLNSLIATGTVAKTGLGGYDLRPSLASPSGLEYSGGLRIDLNTSALNLSPAGLGFANQAANKVFAGPASGGAATPAFRSLAAADLGTGTANATTFLRGDLSWQPVVPAWATKVIGSFVADPTMQTALYMRSGNVAATPNNISTSIARCSLVLPPATITVNRIRWYGVGATTGVYRVALYRLSDLARLTGELSFNTAAATWGSVDAGGITLTAGTPYFVACSVNAAGNTAGVGCVGTTTGATDGQIATAPGSLPGNLLASAGYIGTYLFQFPVTGGALPDPAATLQAQGTWVGGMPAFYLDNDTAA
jgi:hypothetical protein